MGKMKVYELAKELGMQSKELVEKLIDLKYDIKNHMSILEEADIDKIRKQLKVGKEPKNTGMKNYALGSVFIQLQAAVHKAVKAALFPVAKTAPERNYVIYKFVFYFVLKHIYTLIQKILFITSPVVSLG